MFGVSNSLLAFSAAVAALVFGVFKLVRARLFFRHLDVMARFPANTHPQHFYTYMSHKFALPGIFYIDTWPFMEPQMVITDPDAAMQVLSVSSYPKHPTIENFLRPFTGKDSIAASNGERWKANHRMVGSGFTPTYVKPMLGMIAEQVLVFHARLRALARDDAAFSMEEESAKMVFDVVGKIVFGYSLEAQREGSPLLHDLRGSISPATTVLGSWNPLARRRARAELEALRRRVHDTLAASMTARSIMDRIVLDRIQALPGVPLDERFFEDAVTNLKALLLGGHGTTTDTFTFAAMLERANQYSLKALLLGGHGTTTDTFTFAAMLLSVHPEAMARLRREHDEVFAPGLDATVALIEKDPKRTNRLEYTNAVIKETLRFFPIGFTIRAAPPGTTSLSWQGRAYPVEGVMVVPCAHTSHMDASLWGDPKVFRPERFLGEEGAATHRYAWRAFERGPRACIAQDLAMDELRVMLLLTARWFDFETVVEGTSERVMLDLDKLVGDLAFQE
ncbi:Cytochrome monooxygenase aflN like protein [Verticillium longisporum]|uniref:Cytochrome monooxygenase aflN like protein n=1 Tax=Verticillium longisporum TaxID=100787 RepID=A0A8I3A1P0_VERLO|nr:Cytochrome monooxygenase aflN like protein [Verticillium longisporum]